MTLFWGTPCHFRVNIQSDPLVKAAGHVLTCKKCHKVGHTARSCKIGLAACDDDVIVNSIIIAPSADGSVGAEGDQNESPAVATEDIDSDGEEEMSDSEDEEYDLDEINAFNTYYNNIEFVYRSQEEGVEDTDEDYENDDEEEEDY